MTERFAHAPESGRHLSFQRRRIVHLYVQRRYFGTELAGKLLVRGRNSAHRHVRYLGKLIFNLPNERSGFRIGYQIVRRVADVDRQQHRPERQAVHSAGHQHCLHSVRPALPRRRMDVLPQHVLMEIRRERSRYRRPGTILYPPVFGRRWKNRQHLRIGKQIILRRHSKIPPDNRAVFFKTIVTDYPNGSGGSGISPSATGADAGADDPSSSPSAFFASFGRFLAFLQSG